MRVKKVTFRESVIEEKVCAYAVTKGVIHYKFTSPNRRAVPDRMLINSNGFTWFIEFKATGKKATVPQEREHTKLRAQNKEVYVVDDIDQGKTIIDTICSRQEAIPEWLRVKL